jgi:L-fucose mutarotase
MLKTGILHPELLRALAEAGHGARILMGDSNYPVTVKAAPSARRVYLNFTPGMVDGVSIIRALAAAIPVESALYMTPDSGETPEIVKEYQKILGGSVLFESTTRFPFYDEASSPDTCLVIASGEQRVYANLLLTVGVRKA